MKDEFDGCIDDKVCVYETIISGGYIKQEPSVTEDHLSSNNCYVIIKENFDDSVVIAQETGCMTNCTNNRVCKNKTIINGGYIQKEPCHMNREPESIHSYQDIKNEDIDDVTVIVQETELMADCIDDKVCVYETVISGGYMQKEPCSMNREQGNIHNYQDIKNEDIHDMTVITQETELMADCIDNKVCVYETIISGGYIKPESCIMEDDVNKTDVTEIAEETGLATDTIGNCLIRCEGCGGEYDMYCLKCPMLNRIFDGIKPNKINSVQCTLPKNFVDICQTSYGVLILALRTIPKGVVFGPFEGLNSTNIDAILEWTLKNVELPYINDAKQLNWMQYVRRVNRSCYYNLIPFQYEDQLYYHSNRHINVGDELIVCSDNDSQGNGNQDLENGYWKLDDTYACSLCCIGYKTISHLTTHNSRCPKKRNDKNFCKAIIQCAFCKIYLDEKEYLEYHMYRCCDRKTLAVPTIRRLTASSSVTTEPFLNETVESTSQGVHFVDNTTVVTASCSTEASTQTDTVPFIIEETSPSNEEMGQALETELSTSKRRRFAEPRYLGDIKAEDVATPRRAKRTLRMVVESAQRHAKKVRSLQEQVRYMKKKLHLLKDLINDLKEKKLISESAAESLLVYVTI